MESTLIAIVCLALGVSFLYKTILAVFLGKVTYWSGFLPLAIISPIFIHLPAGKRSLIKTTQQWWVHILAGPVFFLLTLISFATGADQLGLPGTESVNFILTLGRSDVPAAITFSKEEGYKFPIFGKASETVFKLLTQPVLKEQEEATRLTPPPK